MGKSERRAQAQRILTWVLALALVASIASVVYISTNPPQTGDAYTEFYVLGSDGNASDYPTTLAPGESDDVIVGITNNEFETVQYRVAVTWNETKSRELTTTVQHDATEEIPVTLTAPEQPGRYRVQFLLYNGTSTEPSVTNRLWISVRNASGS